jgi:argininosuccinate lyase
MSQAARALQWRRHLWVLRCAGALAGNPFGVDRRMIAEDLGFIGGVCPNSMDAVSDRGWLCQHAPTACSFAHPPARLPTCDAMTFLT